MNINLVSNVAFSGVWKNEVHKATTGKGLGVDNIYVQTRTYHPFKDEIVPASIKEMQGVKGVKYLEYRSDDDNYGAEDKSISVQDVKIGEKLDITEAQYNELITIKKAGEEAAKKLASFGEVKTPELKLATREMHDATTVLGEVDQKTLNKIIACVEFVA